METTVLQRHEADLPMYSKWIRLSYKGHEIDLPMYAICRQALLCSLDISSLRVRIAFSVDNHAVSSQVSAMSYSVI
jgi:hypothetical protein